MKFKIKALIVRACIKIIQCGMQEKNENPFDASFADEAFYKKLPTNLNKTYLQQALVAFYDDSPEKGAACLKDLYKRLIKTMPDWKYLKPEPESEYLFWMYEAKNFMELHDWSNACNMLEKSLLFLNSESLFLDITFMSNLKYLLEENFLNVME